MGEEIYDVVIIGGGPGGLSAALYAARSRLKTLVVEKLSLGGQISTTDVVENYPGFPEPIGGPELAQRLQSQAERFGAKIEFDEVKRLEDRGKFKAVIAEYSGEILAKAVIIASGADPRKLGVPGEDELRGRGVSYCATCDGAFFKDKEVVVVGGGDAAVEEGIYLTRFAQKVNIVHRRDRLRATKMLQDRAFKNEKMNFIWNTVVTSINGRDVVEGVTLKNVKTNEVREFPCDGVFVYIGHNPNVGFLNGLLKMDDKGLIEVNLNMETSVPGIYAIGDVRTESRRQMVTACGDGATAALMAEKHIESLGN
ncbi:MAG: thioredoxin-disulfide reductase [bacterium]